MATIKAVVARLGGPARIRVWAAPVVVIAAIGAAAAVIAPSSGAAASLPRRTAAQLLVAVDEHADSTALSGQVRETSNLGFPASPGSAAPASLSWQTFLTGSHDARVWVNGPTHQRLALIGELSEADVTHNGRDVWTYTSASNSVSHGVLPADQAETDQLPDATTPAAAVDKLIKTVGPTTAVSVDDAQRVAGRSAYTLTLKPRDTRSTVHSVSIAIDAAKYVPLRLQVFGAGSKPAMELRFTNVTFHKPASSTFDFTVPQGATVTRDPLDVNGVDAEHHDGARSKDGEAPSQHGGAQRPSVIGTGWTSVLEFHGGLQGFATHSDLLDQLTTTVPGTTTRLLHTALVNAVLTSDGRAFVGAVSPTTLEHVAATTS